jgi:hypothetical protein
MPQNREGQAMNDPSITAIICPNGVGHFRRTVEVLARLSEADPRLTFDIVCERWQRERMSDWEMLDALEKGSAIRWRHGFLDPGVTWAREASGYADGRLKDWVNRLREADFLLEADLVLSDNLAGILEIRPDAVLMGSFLWSDVFEAAHSSSAAVREFIEWERALLERFHPPMLCVGAIAMPGVLSRTAAVKLPWMRAGDRPDRSLAPAAPEAPPRVAVLIGASGAADSVATEVVSELLKSGRARVALPAGLYEKFQGHPAVSRFLFRQADFQRCDLALCRAGVGTLHDCLFHCLPMILLHESENAEMVHNGARIEALGFGFQMEKGASGADVAGRIIEISGELQLSQISAKMAAERMDGIALAAQWLQERLG